MTQLTVSFSFIKVVSYTKIGLNLKKRLTLCRMQATAHCTEVRFASFFSGGFTTIAGINPLERKLTKHTFVHCGPECRKEANRSQFKSQWGPIKDDCDYNLVLTLYHRVD